MTYKTLFYVWLMHASRFTEYVKTNVTQINYRISYRNFPFLRLLIRHRCLKSAVIWFLKHLRSDKLYQEACPGRGGGHFLKHIFLTLKLTHIKVNFKRTVPTPTSHPHPRPLLFWTNVKKIVKCLHPTPSWK